MMPSPPKNSQPVQRTERGQLVAFFNQPLQGYIDQIRGIVHGLGSVIGGSDGEMAGYLRTDGDVEIPATGAAVPIQSAGGELLFSPGPGQMETPSNMREDSRRHLRKFRKVAQALKGFEQHEHEELSCEGRRLLLGKREFFQRRCVQVDQFLGGERRLEARIDGPLDGSHSEMLLSVSCDRMLWPKTTALGAAYAVDSRPFL
jgi:hypothetical protein